MTESELYQHHVKPFCKKLGILCIRFESPRVPDIYLSKNNNVIWAEMKCINKPQSLICPSWRPGQLAWIKKHEEYGCFNICLVLFYYGGIYVLPPKEFYNQEELVCQKELYLKMLKRI